MQMIAIATTPKLVPSMIAVFRGLQLSFSPKEGAVGSSSDPPKRLLVPLIMLEFMLSSPELSVESLVVPGDAGKHAFCHGKLLYPTHSRHLTQAHISN